jgi:hypothetical protein
MVINESILIFFMGATMRKGVRGDLQKLKELLERQDTDV